MGCRKGGRTQERPLRRLVCHSWVGRGPLPSNSMWLEWKAAVWGRCLLLRERTGRLWKSQKTLYVYVYSVCVWIHRRLCVFIVSWWADPKGEEDVRLESDGRQQIRKSGIRSPVHHSLPVSLALPSPYLSNGKITTAHCLYSRGYTWTAGWAWIPDPLQISYPDPQRSDSHSVKALSCVKYEWWNFFSANVCMVCVCMFICILVHGVISPCMIMQRSEQDIVFLYDFRSYYLEAGWLLNRKPAVSARLFDQYGWIMSISDSQVTCIHTQLFI